MITLRSAVVFAVVVSSLQQCATVPLSRHKIEAPGGNVEGVMVCKIEGEGEALEATCFTIEETRALIQRNEQRQRRDEL